RGRRDLVGRPRPDDPPLGLTLTWGASKGPPMPPMEARDAPAEPGRPSSFRLPDLLLRGWQSEGDGGPGAGGFEADLAGVPAAEALDGDEAESAMAGLRRVHQLDQELGVGR